MCSLAGGTGASSTAGLLAAGLAGVLDAADPQTPVALLDPAPAGGSPWPYWLARERTAGPLGPQPSRPADLYAALQPVRWQLPGDPGDRPVHVWTDLATQVPPAWERLAVAGLAHGDRPGWARDTAALVIDGPGGQGAATRWLAQRGGHPDPASGAALVSALTAGRRPEDAGRQVSVLLARADHHALGDALQLVTDLDRLAVSTQGLVVALLPPPRGIPRAARPRLELLRDRVAAVVLLEHDRRRAPGQPPSPGWLAAGRRSQLVQAVLTAAVGTSGSAPAPAGRQDPTGGHATGPPARTEPTGDPATPAPTGTGTGTGTGTDPFAVLSDRPATLGATRSPATH